MEKRKVFIAFAAGFAASIAAGLTFKKPAVISVVGSFGFLLWIGSVLWVRFAGRN